VPDGRFLSRSIAQSEQLAGVSLEADYVFSRCIPHLDRDGRMAGNPALVKAITCPLRPEITADLMPDLLRQLAGAGLVRWYECDGKQILEFPRFRDHQKGMKPDREAPSRFPASTSAAVTDLCGTSSGPTPEEVQQSSAQVKVSEVKVSKDSETTSPEAAPPPDTPVNDAAHIAPTLRRLGIPEAQIGQGVQWWRVLRGKRIDGCLLTDATLETMVRLARDKGAENLAAWYNPRNAEASIRFRQALAAARKAAELARGSIGPVLAKAQGGA